MSSFFPIFARFFFPLLIVVLAGTYLSLQSHREIQRTEIGTKQSAGVALGAAMLERRTQTLGRDIEYLARHSFVPASFDKPGYLDFPAMEKDFIDFLLIKQSYDQMRWIDANGQERVRVKLLDGLPVKVMRDDLVKETDAFFGEAMKNNPGQVYVSSITLKRQAGEVIQPYIPIIRLAIPLSNGRGEKLGVITLDYLADEMIAYVEAVTPTVANQLSLVTTAGYFFHAPDPADEWGFIFNDPQRSMPLRFPEAWRRIQKEARGQFIDANGLWTFQTVYPLKADTRDIDSLRKDIRQPPTEDEMLRQWRVISRLDADKLSDLSRSEEHRIYFFSALLALLGAIFSGILAQMHQQHKKSEIRFKVFFERAMVGMAITSPAQKWLSINPALCQMLGYTAEALSQKTWGELTHPDDLKENLDQFERAVRGEIEGYELTKRFIRSDGQAIETMIATQVMRKTNGCPDYFMVIVEDVSQQKNAERAKAQSLETLRRFIDHLPGVAYIKDHETRILVASQHFHDMLGLLPDQVIGRQTNELFLGDQGQKIVADDLRIMANGKAETIEETFGEQIFETIKFPIFHENGPTDLGGISIDITERKKNEQRLKMQAARDEVLLEMPSKSLGLDEKAFMSYVLDMAEVLTGSEIGFMHFVNPDQESIELVAWSAKTLSKYCQAAFDCHYPITEAGIWAEAARQKQPVVYNDYAKTKNKRGLPEGHSALIRLISVPVIESSLVRMMTGVGNKTCLYTETDIETVQLLGNEAWRIVNQQRAEKALKIANQVVNASQVVCFRWAASEGWPVIFVSDNVKQWGYLPADLQAGKPSFAELVHPDDLARVSEKIAKKSATGVASYEQEYRIITAKNCLIWVVDRTIIQRDSAGNVLFYDGVLTDITERKKQQLLLLKTLAEQRELNRKLGEAQGQLLQSEKMASIGQLAAGIAHELNNPIGFVHSNLGTLDGYVRDMLGLIDAYEILAKTDAASSPLLGKITLMREEQDFNYIREDIAQLLLESKDGLARVRRIVQDLKAFSHVSEQTWQWADLHQGLDSTLNIVWNEIKYKCKVIKEYGDLPKVYCMISQLNQVFMNLLVNASHAIEQQGTITLHTSLLSNDEVCIAVSDTGKGIEPEHINRIFEPFFTTKPVGKGTGLGLSLSYGIINKHHGRIEVESILGQGTTFRVILPINQATGTNGEPLEATA